LISSKQIQNPVEPLIAGDRAVTVVGSRAALARGLALSARMARELVSHHVTVFSGLALGIDTAAHRAALAAGGRAAAIIGTGIGRAYPAENRHLREKIASRALCSPSSGRTHRHASRNGHREAERKPQVTVYP